MKTVIRPHSEVLALASLLKRKVVFSLTTERFLAVSGLDRSL